MATRKGSANAREASLLQRERSIQQIGADADDLEERENRAQRRDDDLSLRMSRFETKLEAAKKDHAMQDLAYEKTMAELADRCALRSLRSLASSSIAGKNNRSERGTNFC